MAESPAFPYLGTVIFARTDVAIIVDNFDMSADNITTTFEDTAER
jgi:hypothetical protein